ncbi:MAG: Zn-dependent oligopeptidase [Actinomycetota bacterium]|nr:Zn-dependent oligopeptidase [Actinomycetota bacterium]
MNYDLSGATVDSVAAAASSAINKAEQLISKACASPEPTYAARVAPLDDALIVIADAGGYGPFLANCHVDEAVRDAGNETKELLEKWSADLVFRPEVHTAVSSVDTSKLSGLEARSVKFWKRDLRRAGHQLDQPDQQELQKLRARLIELEVAFSRNIAEFVDHIEVARTDMAGLPDAYVAGLEAGVEPDTVRITLDYPDYIPFMQQATNRENRKRLQHKYYNQAAGLNKPILKEAIAARARIAELLGYDTWADHQMELKMADTASVRRFYDSIVPGLTVRAETEKAALQQLLEHDHPGEQLSAWDWMYYDTQQARSDFGVDQNVVATYFPLEPVVRAMLDITAEVFGIRYERVDGIGTWHDDVRTFQIVDAASERHIAVFFLDLHPRKGKYTHAACWSLQKGRRLSDGSYRQPFAGVLANFTKPTEHTSSLLKHDEVLTLFHEFGHVLHECLTEVELGKLAGFDTEWDFVEAPSQIMENWIWNVDVLKRFAMHHDTNEPIPAKLVESLVAARNHNVGLKLLRQVYYGNLDLDFHTSGPTPDLEAIDRATHKFTLLPIHEDTFFAAGFGHLMGAYDAGYYGYLWSMVYGDDMFSVFQQEGILSPGVGARYRKEILATGASRDAIDHLRAFLGREPNATAFMNKIGLAE